MKKYLLKLLLVSCLLFWGLSAAHAQTIAITSVTTTAGANGLSNTPVAATASNYAVAQYSVVGSGAAATGTITSLTFTMSGTSNSNDNTFYTTAYLYQSTSSTYTPGTTNVPGNLVGSAPADGAQSLTISTNLSVSNTTNTYLYLVLSNTLGNTAAGNFAYSVSNSAGTATISLPGTGKGPKYTFVTATPVTSTATSIGTPGTLGLAASPVTVAGNGLAVYGLKLVQSATGSERSISSLTFTGTATPAQNENYFFSTAYLYSSPSSTFSAGSATLVSTITPGAATTLVFPALNILLDPATTLYYFVVVDYNPNTAVSETWLPKFTAYTSNTTVSGTPVSGNTYTFTSVAPVTITAASNGTAGTLGLTANPIGTLATNIPIYGLKLTSGAGATKTLTALTFTSNAVQTDDYYFTNFNLYSSTSSTFPGVGNAGATKIGSTFIADATNTVTFSGLNISVAANATLYYFVVVDYSTYIAAASSSFQLNFGSATGATVAANAGNKGFAYTVTSPSFTLTTNVSGISTGPYYYGVNGNPLESFGVTATTASTLTSVTLTSTVAYSSYFSNLTVFYSTNANYAAAVAGGQLTAANITTTGTTTLTINFAAPVPVGTTALYFYVLGDFTLGDDLLPTTFQFKITGATATSGGNAIVLTNAAAINGTNYNLISPVVLDGPITTGLATANQLNYDQTGVGILGFSVQNTTTASTNPAIPEIINTMDFSANISSFTSTVGTFFSNMKLYVNTSNTLVGATAVSAGYSISSLTSNTDAFSITGLNEIIPVNTTLYYFIVADFTAPTNFSSTFQLSCNDVINNNAIVFIDGAPVTGTKYNCAPSVTLAAASTTGLAANPITATAPGIGIFGFSVTSGPALTFKTFNLFTTQPTGYTVGSNFANFKLYASTTNSFSSAVSGGAIAGATFTITNPSTLTITGLTQTISGTTKYYFIVADYTVPAVATTFELNLQSVATATTTYTTGGPVYGTNYTCTGPLGVWYWTGKSNANQNWETVNNWLNANTGTASGYPGQGANSDIAVFSPTYTVNNYNGNLEQIILTATKTLSQILVTAGNTYQPALNIQNGLTCTITNGITLGDPAQSYANSTTTSYLLLYEYFTNGSGQYYIGGTSSIYNDGLLLMNYGAIVTTAANSVINLYGTAADPAQVVLQAGTLTSASNTTINNIGPASLFYLAGGTYNATNSTFVTSGFASQFENVGATATLTGCTFNATGVSNTAYLTGIAQVQGTTNFTGSSTINLGTSASNGNYTTVQVQGGTFNVLNSSKVNLLGPSSDIFNQYYKVAYPAIVNVTNSTINLGSTGGADGAGSQIYNTTQGFFNLNAASVINMNGTNTAIYNTSGTNKPGTNLNGVFIAASTSVINPISTTAVINNTIANGPSYFTLLSDINGSATIGKLGTGAKISGLYNVQRYLNGGSLYLRNYRLLSSPVNTDAAISNPYNHIDLSYLGAQATIPYSSPTTTFYGAFIGGPDASFGGGIHTTTNPLMYLYQENIAPGADYNRRFTSGKNVGVMSLNTTNHTIGTFNDASGYGSGSGNTSPSVPSTSIARPGYDQSTGVAVPPGNAYIMYYIDNDARTTAASVASIPNSSTVSASGYINQSQVQLFMWGSGSGNLTDTYGMAGVRLPGITIVGNPYPSTIDLNQVWFDNSSAISTTMYQLDKTNQQFDTYNASTHVSSTALSSQYVASGQGFYIHVDSLGSTKAFYFQEDMKTPSTTSPFFPPISNFAVVTPPGQTIDNVNTGGTGVVADSFNTPSANASGSSSGFQNITDPNLADAIKNSKVYGPATDNMVAVQSLKLAAANPNTPHKVDSSLIGTRRLSTYATIAPKKKIYNGPEGKHEAAQPKHTPPAPGIANPTVMHLKFVVDSTDYDEVAVCFNKAWSDKFDRDDSFDLDGQSGKVYLSSYSSDNVRTSINMLGDYTPGKRIKLYVKAAADGIYQLQMSDIANFNKNQYSVFLIDNLKKDSLDLTLYKSYNFNFTASDTAQFRNRFVLAIEHKPIAHYELLTFAGSKVVAGVQLDWKTINEKNYTQFELQKLVNNTYVSIATLQSDSLGAYGYVDQHPTLGNNTYRLQQTDGLGTITYSAPVTIGYNTTVNSGLTVYPNPAKSTMTVTLTTGSTATVVATADIYNTSGKLITHKVVNSNSFTHDVSGYDLGAYIIELKDKNGTLVGKSKFVKVQ